MPRDPETGARSDEATIIERDDATHARPTDDKTLPIAAPPGELASDVTLPPPPRPAPLADTTPAPDASAPSASDATLRPPSAPLPATGEFASASTLPPPSRTVTGKHSQRDWQPTLAPPVARPSDATLDPDDPQAKAFEEAIARSSPLTHVASFGDYQLLETIAKGGMGVVYKARQRKLNRIVAIKMILAGQFADQTDVDRFYAEAAAAGKLRHPNIVGIHEIGEVNGQHFFSMDYIEGESLSSLVRENALSAARAAQFVKTIAETMQFAHEHDIVHRDLKPSNVLVDKSGRPLITDFGLAKQVSNNQSQLTMEGAIVGTPSYMPPEQAAGDGARVGTWSDIYSTGAILYELVTGRPPFRAASPFETVRQVLETEPLSPRLVNPNVPKDLETICLKCLQKEPAKRYASSQELADELGRFLRNEPIKARPIGRIARLWRLCRRNPVPATAIAASVLFLIIAACGATVGLVQTRRALAVSEASFREQMNAVNDLLTSVSENTLLNQPGLQPLRKDLLQHALAYYQRFARQRANDPAVQDELASAYFRIGAITETLESLDKALPAYETARDMQEELLAKRPEDPARLEALGTTLNAIGTLAVRTKDYSAAQRAFARALETRQQLVARRPQDSELQRLLANTRMNIGLAHYNAGETSLARKELEEAQRIRQVALEADPQNFKLRRDLGKGDFNLGNVNWFDRQNKVAEKNFLSAVATFQKLIDQQPNDLENNKLHAICLRFLGDIHADEAPERANKHYGQSIERLNKLVSRNPEILDYQLELAGVWMNVGWMENKHGKSATVQFKQARQILRPLAERYPSVPRFQRDLAKTLHALGYEQQASRDFTEAREQFQQASRILAALCEQHSADADYAAQYAGVLIDLGQLEFDQGQPAAAAQAFAQAGEVRHRLSQTFPDDPWQRFDWAVALRKLGMAQQSAGDQQRGQSSLRQAKAILVEIQPQMAGADDVQAELELVNEALAAPADAS